MTIQMRRVKCIKTRGMFSTRRVWPDHILMVYSIVAQQAKTMKRARADGQEQRGWFFHDGCGG
jgi:hypothetical protein